LSTFVKLWKATAPVKLPIMQLKPLINYLYKLVKLLVSLSLTHHMQNQNLPSTITLN